MDNVRVFDANPHLADLFISVVSFWLGEQDIKSEAFVIQSLVELLEVLVYSPTFWTKFKGADCLHVFI